MKNRHGIEPRKFMKKKDNHRAIYCDPSCGPRFGYGTDIGINDNYNNDNGGWTNNDRIISVEESKNFVLRNYRVKKTAQPEQQNYFKVSDYEVFTYK